MTLPLEGRVAFITGLARGQGRAHALRLAEMGVDIIGVDLCAQIEEVDYPLSTRDDLDQTIKLVEDRGRRIVADVGDVRDVDSLDAVYQRGLAEFGRLDFVIANAGVMPVFGPRANEIG